MPAALQAMQVSLPGYWSRFYWRAPQPGLRGLVLDLQGYEERVAAPLPRREIAVPRYVLVIDFETPYRVLERDERTAQDYAGHGFLAGLHDGYSVTLPSHRQAGLQANLTPAGAWALLGRPLDVLQNHVVGLDDLFGAAAGRLVEALAACNDWSRRFDLLEAALARRMARGPTLSPVSRQVVQTLRRHGGRLRVTQLAQHTGISRRALQTRCREELGAPPKLLARLYRLHRTLGLAERARRADWCEIADHAGFADQAHMIHEFRRLTGLTPIAWRLQQRRDPVVDRS